MERSTRQNAAIREALATAGRPLTPTEVLSHARQQVAALGIATVYRHLKSLLDEGAIQAVNLPGESARYEPSSPRHHHHFRCDHCARVFDVLQCPGNLRRLAPPGFTVERHEITLYGRCKECKTGSKRRRPPATSSATRA